MAKQRPAALVFAGPVSRGTLMRLPGLPEQLQLIKSSSIATASRALHALRTGVTVRTFEELGKADLILISVPDNAIEPMMEDLADANLEWSGRSAVLYDSVHDSTALSRLKQKGAHTATLNYQEKPEQFLVEGDIEAIRRVRSLAGRKPLLHLKSKKGYVQAVRTSTTGFYPLIASILDDLRAAGMDKVTAEKTTAALIEESARTFLRAGRRMLKPAKQSP